jgi:hypothetical protein
MNASWIERLFELGEEFGGVELDIPARSMAGGARMVDFDGITTEGVPKPDHRR